MAEVSHLVEFSKDGAHFACIDDAGKLKIWDTNTSKLKQEFVPNIALGSSITCFRWIGVGNEVSPYFL